jgi:hypothetical protein
MYSSGVVMLPRLGGIAPSGAVKDHNSSSPLRASSQNPQECQSGSDHHYTSH